MERDEEERVRGTTLRKKRFFILAVALIFVFSGVFLVTSAPCACIQEHSYLGEKYRERCKSGEIGKTLCVAIGYSAKYEEMKGEGTHAKTDH